VPAWGLHQSHERFLRSPQRATKGSRIRQFLLDSSVLSEALDTTEIEAPIQQSLHAEGKRRADRWGQTPAVEIRRFLLAVVTRITVKDDGIEIVLSRRRLTDALLGTDVATRTQSAGANENSIDGIRLDFDARLGRKGNELQLVLTAPGSDRPTSEPDLPMLKAICRARDWYEKLTSGEVDSLHTIAKQMGVGKRYVARIFQCAFLAPDIVEAILDGRQPPELTLERLRSPLPIAWAEQRRVLGFAKS
jgi:site-specific DNA recombinase